MGTSLQIRGRQLLQFINIGCGIKWEVGVDIY
jgi:hypothetical protein